MSYIKGKYKQSIFESETGYKVGLFRVQETDDKELGTNKTITFTGYFGILIRMILMYLMVMLFIMIDMECSFK